MNPDEPLRTKNLAEEDPASMEDTLAGYPWLPRMIDKARAARSAALGEYFRYPCPIDQQFLRLLGVGADHFADIATAATRGADLLRALSALNALGPEVAEFDPVGLNAQLHKDPGS